MTQSVNKVHHSTIQEKAENQILERNAKHLGAVMSYGALAITYFASIRKNNIKTVSLTAGIGAALFMQSSPFVSGVADFGKFRKFIRHSTAKPAKDS